jgi:DNA-damage-inducible protein D
MKIFLKLINKAEIACFNSKKVNNHLGDSIRKIIDYKLSCYACYLIVQNGNPKNKAIALSHTYFAVQTRKVVY